jgi:alpha/beta hydrolase family protein
MRLLGLLCSLLVFSAVGVPAARADLTRLDMTSLQPFGSFRAGNYVISHGRIYGELSPRESIPGIDKAKRNARGMVEYSARIVLITPEVPSRGNGTLLVDIPNRGNAYAQALYNSPRDEPFQSGTFEQGTGFLQDHGFSVAEVYWELGKGADLPSFVDGDGRTRYVEGAGFAIVRDAADFLTHASASGPAGRNPLAGAVRRTLASGKSQSGRFLKSFLLHGFNVANGRQVFDGMHIFVAGSGSLPIMQVGAGPESSANAIPTFDNPEIRGVNEEPLTVADLMARLDARGETPPKILFVNSTTDYYGIRASLARTGAAGTAERPIPPNARMYDIAGAPHVLLRKAPAACTLPQGRLDWTPVSRALLLRLEAWVATNAAPPASKLMPLEPAGEMMALRAPAHLPVAVIELPKRDADGNALGGVRLPDLAAPMGIHSGLNQPASRECMLIGAYAPFPSPKIAQRYRNRDDYVNHIRLAALDLMQEGFLLPDDAAVIIQAAASNPAFQASATAVR